MLRVEQPAFDGCGVRSRISFLLTSHTAAVSCRQKPPALTPLRLLLCRFLLPLLARMAGGAACRASGMRYILRLRQLTLCESLLPALLSLLPDDYLLFSSLESRHYFFVPFRVSLRLAIGSAQDPHDLWILGDMRCEGQAFPSNAKVYLPAMFVILRVRTTGGE